MYKQAIVVRKDLDMGKGKLVAQCLHAALGAIRKIDEETMLRWEAGGSKKVVLKVKDMKELMDVEKKSKKIDMPHFLVRDAGLTQVKRGTPTALGIGPAEEKNIDRITGKLKLL